jgi:endonuclease-3
MSASRSRLVRLLGSLRLRYGKPSPPPATDAFASILWEQVAYLADDARRHQAFAALAQRIGLTPRAIRAAAPAELLACARLGGPHAEVRAGRMRESADLVLEELGGDLDRALDEAGGKAGRILTKFPMIGAPGAEKILLFTGRAPVLALESNGLRVLLRLGYGDEGTSYASSYRSVQQAAAPELRHDVAWLQAAHQLLRVHGQELCRRTTPHCAACPLAADCPSAT